VLVLLWLTLRNKVHSNWCWCCIVIGLGEDVQAQWACGLARAGLPQTSQSAMLQQDSNRGGVVLGESYGWYPSCNGVFIRSHEMHVGKLLKCRSHCITSRGALIKLIKLLSQIRIWVFARNGQVPESTSRPLVHSVHQPPR
jgi:hypothetical protein